MSLTKNDLTAIEGLLVIQKEGIIEEVKDLIDFRVEKAEQSLEKNLGSRIDRLECKMDKGFKRIDREINELIEINRAFIGQFDNHEKRITKLEANVQSA